jgi:hypothetical protein
MGDFLLKQPFYSRIANNLRFGFLFTAWVVALCSIIPTFSTSPIDNTIYVAIVLALSILLVPAGYFLHHSLFKYVTRLIYNKVNKESAMVSGDGDQDSVHMSQMFLKPLDIHAIVKTVAEEHKVNIFITPLWVEIAARFIRHSYMKKDSVIFAMEVFNYGFKQHPRDVQVSLQSLK